ncbi:MAG: single-stranded DNA-binding protein, partial [Opitutales bacterium]
EVITKYMRKGRQLMVEGRLKFDQWETNEGQKRSKLGVVLENFQFVGGRDDNSSSGDNSERSDSSGGYESSSPPSNSKPSAASDDTLDEDVPF